MKKIISYVMAFIMIIMPLSSYAYETEEDVIKSASEYIMSVVSNPTVSSIGGEWTVIALARSGSGTDNEYFDKYYQNVCDYVKNCNGILHNRKYTEYSRVVLALTAIEKNPHDVCGYDLVMPLGDYNKTTWQGINGAIWALIALDSGKYEIAANDSFEILATRDMYLNSIVSKQKGDGGWSFGDNADSDPDITAMSLCALSAYSDRADIKLSIEKALEYLSKAQNPNGGYSSYGDENSESCAQVLTALSTLKIPIDDKRFVKNNNTVLDSLMQYRSPDGGFKHLLEDDNNNIMSTEQAMYAIVAYNRTVSGKTSVFDMSDISNSMSDKANKTDFGLNGKHADVLKIPIVSNKTFSDISNIKSKSKIEALASRNIINGMTESTFAPEKTMTRAEFSALVTRALGLKNSSLDIFNDVNQSDWYYGCISTAYKYGIVKGIDESNFNPNGTITFQEAAVMVSRACKMCGLDYNYSNDNIRDILSVYSDYISVAQWASESVAFCFDKGIYETDDIDIYPQRYVLRYQISDMIYNMLDKAKLL